MTPLSTDYFTTRERWRDWRIEANELLNLARVSEGMRVLEIGCGGGGLLRMAARRGAIGIGVDKLPEALELTHLRQDGPGEIPVALVGESGSLPFRSGSFDAILTQHVVEHVRDLKPLLSECKRILAPGGRIALATPNRLYPDPGHFADKDHEHIYGPIELVRSFDEIGLVVESCSTVFPYLSQMRGLRALGVTVYWLFRMLPYWNLRGRTILLSARETC